MTSCARGCCWTPFGCALARHCPCHWGDWLTSATPTGGADATYRDPTSREAIANVMRETRKERR